MPEEEHAGEMPTGKMEATVTTGESLALESTEFTNPGEAFRATAKNDMSNVTAASAPQNTSAPTTAGTMLGEEDVTHNGQTGKMPGE